MALRDSDPEIADVIKNEENRQCNNINLIASENYISKNVLEAQGCVLTNKYAEGYPGKRYYGGCQYVDEAEHIAINRAKDLFPRCFKNPSHVLPRKPFCPSSEKLHIGRRQCMFAFSPGYPFHFHSAPATVDSTHGINEKYRDAPERNEFELPRLHGVIPGLSAPTARADWATARSSSNLDEQHDFSRNFRPLDGFVNKGLELLHPIQNSLQLHPDLFSCDWNVACQSYPIQDWRQDALLDSFPLFSGAIYKSLRFSSFLNLGIKNKTIRACGNVGKSYRFLVGLFQAAEGIRALCGFPQMRHFHQAGNSA